MAFCGVQLHQFLDVRLRLIFPSAHHARSAAIKFDQHLAGREILPIQHDRSFKFLPGFLGQSNPRGGPDNLISLFAIGSSQPLVIHGILRIDRHGLLRAADGRIKFLEFQVTFRQ